MEVIYGGIQFKDDDGQIHSTIEEFNCFTFTARDNYKGDDGVGVWDYSEEAGPCSSNFTRSKRAA